MTVCWWWLRSSEQTLGMSVMFAEQLWADTWQQHVTDSWRHAPGPRGAPASPSCGARTTFSARVISGLARAEKCSCQHPRSFWWWTISFPSASESIIERGDEGCGHRQCFQALQQKLEIWPLKVRFYVISISYCDLPMSSPAKEWNSSINSGVRAFQSKSEAVWFGR